jgi:hypothetical protein
MDEETPIPFKQYFPNLSVGAYFWVVILVSLVVFSIVGYFTGVRVSELPSDQTSISAASSTTQTAANYWMFDGTDFIYSQISGSFITNTSKYAQFVISVSALPSPKTVITDTDVRSFTDPHVGIHYPYMFSRLNPSRSYTVSASACRVNDKTYALECAKNIIITKCTGKIQGKTCLIIGNGNELQSSGEVDFALVKTASGSGLAGQ